MSNLLLQRMKEQSKDKFIYEFKMTDFKEENGVLLEDGEKTLFGIKDNFFFGDVIRQFGDVRRLQKMANQKTEEFSGEAFDLFDAIESYVKSVFTFEDFVDALNSKMSEFFINTLSQLEEKELSKYLKKEYEAKTNGDWIDEDNYIHSILKNINNKKENQSDTKKQVRKSHLLAK